MRRGEIWRIILDPTLRAETQKTRPAVIVSEDAKGVLPLRVIVPLTEWKERCFVIPWLIAILPNAQYSLEKPSAADAFQIRSVSQERFVQPLGSLDNETISQILNAIQIVIGAP